MNAYECKALSCMNVYPFIKRCAFSGSEGLLSVSDDHISKKRTKKYNFPWLGYK